MGTPQLMPDTEEAKQARLDDFAKAALPAVYASLPEGAAFRLMAQCAYSLAKAMEAERARRIAGGDE